MTLDSPKSRGQRTQRTSSRSLSPGMSWRNIWRPWVWCLKVAERSRRPPLSTNNWWGDGRCLRPVRSLLPCNELWEMVQRSTFVDRLEKRQWTKIRIAEERFGPAPNSQVEQKKWARTNCHSQCGKSWVGSKTLSLMTNDFFLNLAGSWPPRGPNHQRVFDIGHCTKHIPHLSRRGVSPVLAGWRRCEPRGQLGFAKFAERNPTIYKGMDEGF